MLICKRNLSCSVDKSLTIKGYSSTYTPDTALALAADVVDTVAVPAVTTAEAFPGHAFYIVDTATFRERLAHTDSLIKLNDTLYLFYKTPEFRFVSTYLLDDADTKEKLLSTFDIYNKALKQPPAPAEVKTITKEFRELQKKYFTKDQPYAGYYK